MTPEDAQQRVRADVENDMAGLWSEREMAAYCIGPLCSKSPQPHMLTETCPEPGFPS